MPIYDYSCSNEHAWDVTKPMRESDAEEKCPRCGEVGGKIPPLFAIDKTAAGSWNQQAYNPGLGCWTHSTKHAEQIAKDRGLEPLGNEPVENVHKHFDQKRKEMQEERWAKDEKAVGETLAVHSPSLAG